MEKNANNKSNHQNDHKPGGKTNMDLSKTPGKVGNSDDKRKTDESDKKNQKTKP